MYHTGKGVENDPQKSNLLVEVAGRDLSAYLQIMDCRIRLILPSSQGYYKRNTGIVLCL